MELQGWAAITTVMPTYDKDYIRHANAGQQLHPSCQRRTTITSVTPTLDYHAYPEMALKSIEPFRRKMKKH